MAFLHTCPICGRTCRVEADSQAYGDLVGMRCPNYPHEFISFEKFVEETWGVLYQEPLPWHVRHIMGLLS